MVEVIRGGIERHPLPQVTQSTCSVWLYIWVCSPLQWGLYPLALPIDLPLLLVPLTASVTALPCLNAGQSAAETGSMAPDITVSLPFLQNKEWKMSA